MNAKIISVCLLALSCGVMQAQTLLKIGTGGATGAYYPIGGGVCQQLKDVSLAGKKVICIANTTGGSTDNLEKLSLGQVDYAIVQADLLDDASKAGNSNLRALFSLHQEFFTMVSPQKSNISQLSDLQGKTINAGRENSASHIGLNRLLNSLGYENFAELSFIDTEQAEAAICSSSIDATVFMVGHPNTNIRHIMSKCQAQIVGLTDEELAKIQDNYPYYTATTIATDIYGQPGETKSFGLRAIFVTNANRDENEVYEVVKAVFSHLEAFKKTHSALSDLQLETMVNSGYTVPLHAGAERFYKEKGYLTEK